VNLIGIHDHNTRISHIFELRVAQLCMVFATPNFSSSVHWLAADAR